MEPRAEERQLIRGIEWLLAHDVDVISSSLGYTTFDDFSGYTPAMLDGRTSTLSRYLDSLLTACPGLVFVQSAGNEGDKAWRNVSFPADVWQVITVGSCDSDGVSRSRSSGVGREDAGYVKPDFVAGASPLGTSFSTPVIAGLCACLLEYRPMERGELIGLLHASARGRSSRLRTGLRHPANRCLAPNAPHAMTNTDLKELLDALHDKYNSPDFIADDPISVPHRYTDRADREIAGFFSATIAWGNRKAIVRSGHRMMHFMDDAPADFVRNASQRELALLSSYVHRTFNGGDLRDFVPGPAAYGGGAMAACGNFFETRYEAAQSMPAVLVDFRREFFAGEHAPRCEKHVSSVERGAACKRLCMYLRWMVRRDDRGVDFGLVAAYPDVGPLPPLDVHVGETAACAGTAWPPQNDWRASRS